MKLLFFFALSVPALPLPLSKTQSNKRAKMQSLLGGSLLTRLRRLRNCAEGETRPDGSGEGNSAISKFPISQFRSLTTTRRCKKPAGKQTNQPELTRTC